MNSYRFASVMKCSLPFLLLRLVISCASSPQTSFPIVNVCASGTIVGPFYAHSPFKTICKLFVRWAGVSPWVCASLVHLLIYPILALVRSAYLNFSMLSWMTTATQYKNRSPMLFFLLYLLARFGYRAGSNGTHDMCGVRWWPQNGDTMEISISYECRSTKRSIISYGNRDIIFTTQNAMVSIDFGVCARIVCISAFHVLCP